MAESKSAQQGHGFHISEYPECGYKIDGIEKIDPRFLCIFCSLVIQEPIQLIVCGHRSCRICFESRAAAAPDGNVTCPSDDCHQVANKNQIMSDRAFKKELDVVLVACMHRIDRQCTWTGQVKDYQLHLDQNHVHYVCSACNEQFSSKAIFNEHITKTCSVIFQSCPLAPLCTEERFRKDEYASHLFTENHQEAINKIITGKYTFQESSNLEEEMESSSLNKELEEKTSEKLDNLKNNSQKLRDETNRLDRNYADLNEHLDTSMEELNAVNTKFNEKNFTKNSLQSNQEKLQKDIEQIQQEYDDNKHISFDGTLTWRIDRVSEKMADAQSERQTSIYSPIFYSSLTGYKMRGRVFPFGDGNARRTHMSVFFFLMKGQYDAILKWPFNHKITFCLIDQSGNNRHVIDSFQPDVKSSSFRRPENEQNIANGIPKFIPLPLIQQDDNPYVRNDVLYIKIIVNLSETPKQMLPFMLSLNPALPNHVQENLIKQESAKQQQQQQQ